MLSLKYGKVFMTLVVPFRQYVRTRTAPPVKKVKASGCSVIIGGHGLATMDMDPVEFQITYLENVVKIREKEDTIF